MKIAPLFALVSSAAAFAPVPQKATSSTSLAAFADELGAMTPLGYFDPIGLCKDGDAAKFARLRYVVETEGPQKCIRKLTDI